MLCHTYSGLIGMAQADAQFSYKANQEYLFREKRQALINSADARTAKPNERKVKIAKHDKTKEQTEMVGQQLHDMIYEYGNVNLSNKVKKIRGIHKEGRSVVDQKIAEEKESTEKEKQSKLTREIMTIEEVRQTAKDIIPEFELNVRSSSDLLRRSITRQLCIQANWNMPLNEMKTSLIIAFIYIESVTPSLETITSKETLRKSVLLPYMRAMKYISEEILDYLYGKKLEKSKGGKRDHDPSRDGSIDAIDLWNFFLFTGRMLSMLRATL